MNIKYKLDKGAACQSQGNALLQDKCTLLVLFKHHFKSPNTNNNNKNEIKLKSSESHYGNLSAEQTDILRFNISTKLKQNEKWK